jgi:hypothetical protein
MPHPRRAAVVTLVVLLAVGAVLPALPASVATVRVGGVGLLWWYCVVAAPALAAAVVLPALARRRGAGARRPPPLGLLALSPAVLAAVAAQVFAGAPLGPLLALAAATAPLAAWLAGPAPGPGASLVARGAAAGSAALLLAAEFTLAGDLGIALGRPRWEGVAVGVALTGAALAATGGVLRAAAAAAGGVALAVSVAIAGLGSGASPWTAFAAVASRPALLFGERSPAATGGVTLRMPARLSFGEPQRVTAVGDEVLQVVERDGGRASLRQWRLAGGESVAVRAGDEVILAAGARVRFEAGRRVPGAPMSGMAWADPRERDGAGAAGPFLGAALTLAGLGAGLPRARRAGARPVAVAAAALAGGAVAVAWGVYAATAGPDLTLGAPAGALFVRMPLALAASLAPAVALVAVAGLGLLLVVVATALREQVAAAVRGGPAALDRLAWAAVVAGAAAVAVLGPADPWRPLVLGSGLAASAFIAPRLVAPGAPRRAAAVVGVAAFAALAAAGGGLAPLLPAVAHYPALGAVPLAWAAGLLLQGPGAKVAAGTRG